MNQEIVALLTKEKGKTAMNEWENDDSDILRASHSVYKWGQFFFHTYFLSCHINISIKTMVLTFKNTMYMHTNLLVLR